MHELNYKHLNNLRHVHPVIIHHHYHFYGYDTPFGYGAILSPSNAGLSYGYPNYSGYPFLYYGY